MKPRLFVTRRWPQIVEEQLQSQFDTVLNLEDRPLNQAEFQTAFQDYDAILATVSDRLPASAFPDGSIRTRLIANLGVGFSHIDLTAAKARHITVTNTPGVLTESTADLAMSLLLAVARRTGEGERQLRAGEWKGWSPTHLMGAQVSGKTLGIIGMGRIGKAMARRAHYGFGMKIIFFNRSRLEDAETEALQAQQLGTIEEVLSKADFVSLHCPGGTENHHLIDAKRLAAMRPGAFLINTARGDIIDEAALADALSQKQIAGAGLDVYEQEPLISPELLRLENVVVLPHLGSATRETRVAMGMKVLENVTAFFNGKPVPDRVEP